MRGTGLGDPMSSELGQAYAEAWSSRQPGLVAEYYAEDGQIVINDGEPLRGRDAIAAMAAGFYAAFPDLVVHCDDFRLAGAHALFAWTLEGHHAETRRRVRIAGWEEWDLDGGGKVASSRGWFDAGAYEDQIAGRASPL
jgi:uncharacterized protein (TIGR02246 family)